MEVKGGGVLGSRKSIKIPGGKHEIMPVLHPLDEADLRNYAVSNGNHDLKLTKLIGFDIVVLPFSVRKKDVNYVKDCMGPEGAHI